MRLFAVLVLVTFLVACGGGSDSSDPTATSPGGSSTRAPSDPGSATATTPPRNGGGNVVTLTGGDQVDISDEGFCGPGPAGDSLQYVLSTTDNGDLLMLQIWVEKYDGNGDYEVGDVNSSYDASITYGRSNSTATHSWDSSADKGGKVTVTGDGTAGTVEATLISSTGEPDIQISGTWTCSTT